MLVAAAAAPLPGLRRGGRLLQLRVIALGRSFESRTITRQSIAIHANDSSARGNSIHRKLNVPPSAAPQGKDRAATSKPRRCHGADVRDLQTTSGRCNAYCQLAL